MTDMLGRRGSSGPKIILFVCIGILFVYGLYIYHDVHTRLKRTEEKAEKFRQQHDSISAQLQVVYEHKSRLESSLQQEKGNHKKTKENMQSVNSDAAQKFESEKRELLNRITALNQQYKMVKSQHEDLQSEYTKLQENHKKIGEDHVKESSQHNQEFMQLKEEKEAEISKLKESLGKFDQQNQAMQNQLNQAAQNNVQNQNQLQNDQQIISALKLQLASLQGQQQQQQQQQNLNLGNNQQNANQQNHGNLNQNIGQQNANNLNLNNNLNQNLNANLNNKLAPNVNGNLNQNVNNMNQNANNMNQNVNNINQNVNNINQGDNNIDQNANNANQNINKGNDEGNLNQAGQNNNLAGNPLDQKPNVQQGDEVNKGAGADAGAINNEDVGQRHQVAPPKVNQQTKNESKAGVDMNLKPPQVNDNVAAFNKSANQILPPHKPENAHPVDKEADMQMNPPGDAAGKAKTNIPLNKPIDVQNDALNPDAPAKDNSEEKPQLQVLPPLKNKMAAAKDENGEGEGKSSKDELPNARAAPPANEDNVKGEENGQRQAPPPGGQGEGQPPLAEGQGQVKAAEGA